MAQPPTPFQAQVYIAKLTDLLNHNYEPPHALCRFFLEQVEPSHQVGERIMVPYLVIMTQLDKFFVAEWLRFNPLSHLELRPQHKVALVEARGLHFANIFCRVIINLISQHTHRDAVL